MMGPMKRALSFYLENSVILAVGVMAGSWFQRNPVDAQTMIYYGIAAAVIISGRLAVVSHRNRADRVASSS